MKNLLISLTFLLLCACAKDDGSPGIAPTTPAVFPAPAPIVQAPICGNVSSCGLFCANTYLPANRPQDANPVGFQYCMHLPADNEPGYTYTP